MNFTSLFSHCLHPVFFLNALITLSKCYSTQWYKYISWVFWPCRLLLTLLCQHSTLSTNVQFWFSDPKNRSKPIFLCSSCLEQGVALLFQLTRFGTVGQIVAYKFYKYGSSIVGIPYYYEQMSYIVMYHFMLPSSHRLKWCFNIIRTCNFTQKCIFQWFE